MKKVFIIITIIVAIIVLIVPIYLSDEKSGQKISNETEKKDINYPETYAEDGIFSDYYNDAYETLTTLSINEKISQLLIVKHTEETSLLLDSYPFGGYVFYDEDFINKSKEEVQKMMQDLQKRAKIPLLMASDEEGGKVTRVSNYPALAPEKFKSSSDLYEEGGFDRITEDTIYKSKILFDLGLNLNFAPVVDIADKDNYIYERTFKNDAKMTGKYATTVIEASKETNVSYTLKHFPGYGNNKDTHSESSVDTRSYEDIMTNDILPFKMGIEKGAEAVMVSHNIVSIIDSENPASLSLEIHNILTKDLNFTGIIITDDVEMDALDDVTAVGAKAVIAGNHLIITGDFQKTYNEIYSAILNESITEDMLNKLVFKVLAWKYYKGLM